MSTYKHIIAATDFYFDAMPVLTCAADLARERNATLSVITVVPEAPYYLASAGLSLTEVEQAYEDEMKKKIEEASKKINYEANYYIKKGNTKHLISLFADKLASDLIVIGSHRHHGGVGRMLGTTATSVLGRAHCDVMVVRINDQHATTT